MFDATRSLDIRPVPFDNRRVLPRLLTLLQFTRIALVFTAVGDGWAAMLLQQQATGVAIGRGYAAAVTAASISLYTFGMALNDLIDRRRDSQLAPGRPLPSGRLSVRSARVVCVGLAVVAVAAGAAIVRLHPGQWASLPLLVATIALIAFYDFAGKYLVAPGLLALGLVRMFQATIAGPHLAVPLHPLLLLVHVTLLSAVCYHLEGKRPRLTRRHWAAVAGGLAGAIAVIAAVVLDRAGPLVSVRGASAWGASGPATLGFGTAAWPVAAAVVGFVVFAIVLRRRVRDPRQAGRQLMLYGLLWLIVYDAAFVAGYVDWRKALPVLALLPLALLSVQAMRAWSRLVELSQRPQYQRTR